MKTRIIQTRFWDDLFVYESDLPTQHLYIYLLTSQYINISGIFQLPESKIKIEAKLTDKQFGGAKRNLQKAGKVFFSEGWVYVVNAAKNNNYRKSSCNEIAYKKEISLIPQHILKYFDSTVHSTPDSTVYSNHKQEIRNKKQEIRNKKENITIKTDDFSSIEQLTELELQEIADKYDVPISMVQEKKLDMEVWMGRKKANRYKDYKLALMSWVRKDKERLVVAVKKKGRGGVVDARTKL